MYTEVFMKNFVCPWWLGYFLANPLRKIIHNPEKITAPFIQNGSRILEIGPGMGFFTIPMAHKGGADCRIYCVDIQEKMLSVLLRKAASKGLSGRIITRMALPESLNIHDLDDSIDFCLLFAVVHEIPDHKKLFAEIYSSMKKGGMLLFSEPSGHVTENEFTDSLRAAELAGFEVHEAPKIRFEHSALLIK